MKSDRLLLGLDLGTTNVKAVVADPDGRVLAEVRRWSNSFTSKKAASSRISRKSSRPRCPSSARRPAAWMPRGLRPSAYPARAERCRFLDAEGRSAGRVISWLDRRGAAV